MEEECGDASVELWADGGFEFSINLILFYMGKERTAENNIVCRGFLFPVCVRVCACA